MEEINYGHKPVLLHECLDALAMALVENARTMDIVTVAVFMIKLFISSPLISEFYDCLCIGPVSLYNDP